MVTLIRALPVLAAVGALGLFAACRREQPPQPAPAASAAEPTTAGATAGEGTDMVGKVVKTDEEWRKELTPEQYRILREGGTEPAFSSPLYHETRQGVFECAGCGLPLFSSKAKFDSGTGWPSFFEPIDPTHVSTRSGFLGIGSTEVRCARCGGHLGDVFDDGPKPTGKRYCIDGVALKFVPAEQGPAGGRSSAL